jgi:hypothetical protein
MSDPAYKYFDEADNFLANFMKLFPSLYGNFTHQQQQDAVKQLIVPTFNNSVEFCQSLQRGIIINKANLGRGGYGIVGDFLMKEDQDDQPVYAIIVSINPNGGFEPFYVPVIIKTGIESSQINISANKTVQLPNGDGAGAGLGNKTIRIININDPITEIVFGSMLGHLYDLGLCPFYAKYFSAYICNTNANPEDYSISFVLEKASITMHDFMYFEPYMGAIRANTEILMNIIFQYIFAVYISKMYLGFTHFDAHLGNVMITHTSNRIIQGKKNISYVYQGTNLENKEFILINLGIHNGKKAWLAMKYNGLMVKIIDHGTCAAHLYAAEYPKYKRDFLIKPDSSFVTDTDFDACQNNSQRRNTWEIQFFLTCLHQSMHNGNTVGMPPDLNRREFYKANIDVLNEFTELFYGHAQYNIGTYLNTNPSMQNIDLETGNVKDFPKRSMNIDISRFSNPKELIRSLARYCQKINNMSENRTIIGTQGTLFFLEIDLDGVKFTKENSLVFNDKPDEWVKGFSNMDIFMENAKKLETGCINIISDDIFVENDASQLRKKAPIDHSDSNRKRLCEEAKKEVEKWHPTNTMKSNLISPLINNRYYDQVNQRFNRNISLTQENFSSQLQARDSRGNLSIFKMQINPKALRMNRTDLGALVYSNHQNWLDYNPLKENIIGEQIEIVRLNIIVVDPKDRYNVKLNYLSNLWDATRLSTSTCFSVNGGYYAVGQSLNKLTKHIITQSNVNEQRPIGFCYNEDVNDGTNGTYLPVPKPYRSQFGVIWCEHSNVLHIDTHEEFMSWHETIDQPIGYLLDNGNIYTTDQPVIKMRDSTGAEDVRGITPVMKDQIRPYKWAFCSGVLLVNNSEVVFNLDMMLNTEFLIVETDQPTTDRRLSEVMTKTHKPPDFTKYKLLQESKNNYKFKSADHLDIHDAYGVKVSNRYSTHNVMGITNTGKIMFFLVEGRGFNAVGLDRVQVAYLVEKFNIDKAISLDGGFSANAVYKMDDDTPKYVQNDPQKRKLSTSMTFTFNPKDNVAPEYIGYTVPTNIWI